VWTTFLLLGNGVFGNEFQMKCGELTEFNAPDNNGDCINLVGNKKAICYNIFRKKINKQRRNRWLKIL